jgi:hypothetical protein
LHKQRNSLQHRSLTHRSRLYRKPLFKSFSREGVIVDGTKLATIHGLFFLVSGTWPLINIHSFQRITGPKTDLWLVKTVGLLIAVIGLNLMLDSYRNNVSFETAVLAATSSLSLALIDVVYATKKTISRIYLLDAAVELSLVMGWAWVVTSWW